MQIYNIKNRKQVYITVLLTMIILMAIFANSFYWPYEEFSRRKLLVGLIIFGGVVIIPILAAKFAVFYGIVQKIVQCVNNVAEKIWERKRRIAFFVCSVLAVIGVAYILTYVISRFGLQTEYNVHLFYTIVAITALILSVILMWKYAAQKPERVFVIAALILGLFCIGVTPNRVGVSWDDEIHYARTLEISNFLNGIMYEADDKNIREYADNIYAFTGYDRESDHAYEESLESVYAEKKWNAHQFSDYNVYSVSYIPSAIGIIFSRGVGLSYTGVFNMGRFFNLLMYISLIYLAMKRVKYGKNLIAVIGLIPTTIFMAASYSYDPWVTGFTILGFSYFFAELQDDEPLKNKNVLIMTGAILVGCLPKATYFPMLFLVLFIPKEKFRDAKQRGLYYAMIIGTGLILVSTYLLPMVINGAGTGDFRGGPDVNSTEQIKFILENPLEYVKILFKFDLEYIALVNSGTMLQKFAYVGNGYLYSTVSLLLVVIAFLDRGKDEKSYAKVKGAGLLGCAAAIIVSTTALYVSFTAVASGTVAGMQGRYIVPTIYPALYSLGFGGITHKINKNAFICVPVLLIAITFIFNMAYFCVLGY